MMFTQVSQGGYVRAEGTLQKQHALNQRSPARSGIENRRPKGSKGKGQNLLAQSYYEHNQHALFTLIEQALSAFFNVNYV